MNDDQIWMSVHVLQNGKTLSVDSKYPGDTTWPNLLNDFVTLLEAAGYCGVRDRISVEDSPFAEGWQGSFHAPEPDEDDKQMSFDFK